MAQHRILGSAAALCALGLSGAANAVGPGHDSFLARFSQSGVLDTAMTRYSPSASSPTDETYSVAVDGAVAGKVTTCGVYNAATDLSGDPVFQPLIARFNANGTADTTFGYGGILTFPVPYSSSSQANACAVDSSGRTIVSLGTTLNAVMVMRLTVNGTPDTTFGPDHNGVAVISNASSSPDVKLDLGGGIVVAYLASDHTPMIARFLSTGSLDPNFGIAGKRALPLAAWEQPYRIAQDLTGKLVVSTLHWNVVRLSAAGSPDLQFGPNHTGATYAYLGTPPDPASQQMFGPPTLTDLAVDGQGRILLSGGDSEISGAHMEVVRLDAFGAPDHNFGSAHTGRVALTSLPNTAAVPLGTFVIGVGTGDTPYLYGSTSGIEGAALIRLTAGGVLDRNFNTNGYVLSNWSNVVAYDLKIDSSQRIVVGGFSTP